MRIYAYSNLICFLLELAIFSVVQWVKDLQALNIFHFHSDDDESGAGDVGDDKAVPLVPL